MPAKIDIPLTFPVDPKVPGGPVLKRDLERLANGVYGYTQRVEQTLEPRPLISPIRTTNTFAAFGVLTRIAPAANQVLYCQLPQPTSVNGGRKLQIARLNTNGVIVLVPLDGSTINGRSELCMLNHVHFVDVLYDGDTNYLMDSPGAVQWSMG